MHTLQVGAWPCRLCRSFQKLQIGCRMWHSTMQGQAPPVCWVAAHNNTDSCSTCRIACSKQQVVEQGRIAAPAATEA